MPAWGLSRLVLPGGGWEHEELVADEKEVELINRSNGLGGVLGSFALFDDAAEGAGVCAVKGSGDRGREAGRGSEPREHGDPGHGLEQAPVKPEGDHQHGHT